MRLRSYPARLWSWMCRFSSGLLVVGTFVAVGGSLWGVWRQHEDARELLRVQVGMEMVKSFDSPEMRRARRVLAGRLLTKTVTPTSELRVLNFFETLGDYFDADRVDNVSVFNDFSYYIERYWIASEPYVKEFRKREDDDTYYSGFEDLYKAMLSEEAASRGKAQSMAVPGPAEIERFLQEESKLYE